MTAFLVLFISTYGNPPSIIPEFESTERNKYVYFQNNKDCENYLIILATKKYKYMEVNSYGSGKFLKNAKSTQFLICKELDKEKLIIWE